MKIFAAALVDLMLICMCWTAPSQGQWSPFTCQTKSPGGFCGSMNYTHFATPNFRNGTEEDEIDSELNTYLILYSTGCSNALVHFLCAYYKPFCVNTVGPRSAPIAFRLPPCRELCLYVRSSCEPALMSLEERARWPNHLDCDQFPLKGDGKSGLQCYPNFYDLEDYQTNLLLPPVPGAPVPIAIQIADSLWSSPTDKQPSLCAFSVWLCVLIHACILHFSYKVLMI